MASIVRLAAACALSVMATGCAQLLAPPYTPDYEGMDALKRTGPDKAAVAAFQPTDPKAGVNKISLRGATLLSGSGSFAKYLENALISDLKEIGVYDSAARTRIDATLLGNDIAIGQIATGTGFIEIELTVTRDGTQRLRKTYAARTSFESSFAGAVAIPKGQLEYANLVRTLLRQVYTDPAFIAAVGR
ncbi:hypothetical protein ACFPPF_18765 [Xenophilus aerolatus]|nr:hypothetical protein [Xenophilus aerolatus]